ncbi:tail assembly protein [Ralstonia solanacearum P673]|uniref:tail assembly protein n=1 Tax=Ralstonia solanacearum TaxID=305 RepID=UPI002029CB21|nr:tail assembly protein [Ralstonia solanacearum]MCL9849879.1 tail assembly protein [Ralstonia solanacearum]MCL9856409.1 tail assembly protein [Ralstonia solanacearum]MCL9861175.1 tail assembly protein [Ralstonia solanacearum]MCL9866085.1 tail assembly protein [Ralstonia solanacearum]MCL9870813.1 tail assembly protein [Ralstonia solanacearum]
MEQRIRTVRLYGRLGARFGRVFRLAVGSPVEAVRALCVQVEGFRRELATSHERGIRYACFVGRRNIGKAELELPPGADDIRIAPVLAGAKQSGLFQTILGAAILAVAYFNPGGFLTGPMVTAAYGMGASMALGGVVQMLSPQQAGLSVRDSPDNGASYNFNGPVNTSAQGNPVPLLYGEMVVGSAVISAGIYAEDQV